MARTLTLEPKVTTADLEQVFSTEKPDMISHQAAIEPASSVTGMRFSEAYCMMSRPVVVSPVKATFATRGLEASGLPASIPKPCTTLTTPLGRMSAISSMNAMIATGVCSAGLSTTQFPPASAGASFHTAMRSGKFHGMICATTPSGSWKWYATVSSSSWEMPPSWARMQPAK